MRLLRLHINSVFTDTAYLFFSVNLGTEEKILSFYSEQGQLFSYILAEDRLYRDEPNIIESTKQFLIVEKSEPLPELGSDQDIKFIKVIPPRWCLFEIINLKELAKQGVSGFGFEYPGLLKESSDLWKAIVEESTEK